MSVVQDEAFFHIHRDNIPQWRPEAEFFFGRVVNRFVQAFDTLGHGTRSPEGKVYFANDIAEHVLAVINKGVPKNTDLAKFYHYDPVKTLAEVTDALTHCLRLIRELVFEEVRIASFPELPSRHRCIWLIPEDMEAVQYWWHTLGKKGKIFRVSATGKLHRTHQSFLHLRTCSVNAWKENAFRYWAGIRGENSTEDEVLFEGFVKVLEEIPLSSLSECTPRTNQERRPCESSSSTLTV